MISVIRSEYAAWVYGYAVALGERIDGWTVDIVLSACVLVLRLDHETKDSF